MKIFEESENGRIFILFYLFICLFVAIMFTTFRLLSNAAGK
jgi:hypothetical protein